MSATWGEIRARSESKMGTMTVFCGDCDMAWWAGQLPCRKHAIGDEHAAIDARVASALEGLASDPMVAALRKRTP